MKDFIAKWASYLIGGAILAILILGFLQVRSCQQSNQRAAQGRVDEGQAGAFRNSATDAINIQSGVATNQATGIEIGRQNEEAIRHAKGADTPVDPAANAAGLRALCRRASHRDDPVCRVPQPHTP